MPVFGVICEYDPFHLGHRWMLEQLHRQGPVVCAMSGCFTQRGEFAAVNKFARAEMAVRNGADLVLELPTPWAVSGAERFARGGVELLKKTGLVTHLAFGSECGDLEALQRVEALPLRRELSGDPPAEIGGRRDLCPLPPGGGGGAAGPPGRGAAVPAQQHPGHRVSEGSAPGGFFHGTDNVPAPGHPTTAVRRMGSPPRPTSGGFCGRGTRRRPWPSCPGNRRRCCGGKSPQAEAGGYAHLPAGHSYRLADHVPGGLSPL